MKIKVGSVEIAHHSTVSVYQVSITHNVPINQAGDTTVKVVDN